MTVTGYGKKTLAIWFLLMLAAAWVSSDSYTMLESGRASGRDRV